MIKRLLYPVITKYLNWDKVIIIYWARQVGKTTLAKDLFSWKEFLYLNWDEIDVQERLSTITKINLDSLIQNRDNIIIDEAQKIRDIWTILKIIHDYHPEKKIIATGSSSFDLANVVNEPLTWRKFEFTLYPLSISELKTTYNYLELASKIPQLMITWLYPEVVTTGSMKVLHELTNSYLYKDILSFWKIKKSDAIIKLLKSLALQIWDEVSYHELWQQCWLHPDTVEQYIEILEKSFIIFRLSPYYSNERKSIKKLKKIYFWDLWIRNSLINNLNPVDLRNDIWWLRENFVIVEFLKKMWYDENINDYYFWRDWKSEIDFLISKNWELHWYEIKYSKDKGKNLQYINEKIKLNSYQVINKNNFLDFVL